MEKTDKQKQKELNDYFDRMPKEKAIKTIKKLLQLIEAVKETDNCREQEQTKTKRRQDGKSKKRDE